MTRSPRVIFKDEWEKILDELKCLRGKVSSLEGKVSKLEHQLHTHHLDPDLQRNLYDRGETRTR